MNGIVKSATYWTVISVVNCFGTWLNNHIEYILWENCSHPNIHGNISWYYGVKSMAHCKIEVTPLLRTGVNIVLRPALKWKMIKMPIL